MDGDDPLEPPVSYDRSDDLRANSVLRDQLGWCSDRGVEEIRLDEQAVLALEERERRRGLQVDRPVGRDRADAWRQRLGNDREHGVGSIESQRRPAGAGLDEETLD